MSMHKVNFRTHLEQRIGVMLTLHTSFKQKEADQRNVVLSDLSTADEKEIADLLVKAYSSSAAMVWDMKCELENLLPLYDMNHPATADKVESTANFIAECIRSCKTEKQLEAAGTMIESLRILCGTTTQVASWVDSLTLLKNNMQNDLTLD